MGEVVQWSEAAVAALLRIATDADDKYSRGVVGLRTGSDAFPGAAVLGVEAAWRAGAGMVRYLGPARTLVLQRRPETVTADGRVQAWVIGSGTDAASRTPDEAHALGRVLAGDAPVVVDAGALDLAPRARAPIVVTPHDREHAALRERLGLGPAGAETDTSADARASAARETARALRDAGVAHPVILLKGAVTVVAAADGPAHAVTTGVPWLATAGTGDVLAGILGTLLAGAAGTTGPADAAVGDDDLAACAASAAWLHGRAADAASAAHAGGPIVALDVAEHVASVVGAVLAAKAEPAGRAARDERGGHSDAP